MQPSKRNDVDGDDDDDDDVGDKEDKNRAQGLVLPGSWLTAAPQKKMSWKK